MKNKIIIMGIIGVGLFLSGCQEQVDINDKVKNEIEKKRQAQEEMLKSQDLSSISGEARAIASKISRNKNASTGKGSLKNNNKNEMNNKKDIKTEENGGLPIDMKLAETCKSVTMKTNMGTIEIELFGDRAPMAVANFCTLSKKGFYDNLIFHRVIKDFMIQGGDPNGNGSGDAGYKFKDELYAGNSNDEYTISLANAGPNTNGSQFFINTKANNFLDSKHTVFGRVVEGQEIVDKIESVQTGMNDKPVEDVVITKVIINTK